MKKIKILSAFALVFCSYLWFFAQPAKAAVELDQEEKNFIQILNDYRKTLGRTELKPQEKLIESADYYAGDISEHESSYNGNHIDNLGRTAEERGTHYGYYFLTENMARGYETGQQVFDGWKGSSAHYDNMTIKEARTVGISRVYKAGSEYGWYWVAVFSDEGVQRLKGNQLKTENLYESSEYNYKKMSVTVNKKSKTKKWAEIKVYEVSSLKKKKPKKIRMIDRDITDTKKKATLFSIGSKNVLIEVYKLRGDKKAVKTKKIRWNKNLKLKFSI